MGDINQVRLVGSISKLPEVRTFKIDDKDLKCVEFGISTSPDGTRPVDTYVAAWNHKADEVLSMGLGLGDRIDLLGKTKTSLSKPTQDGRVFSRTNISVTAIGIVSRASNGAVQNLSTTQQAYTPNQGVTTAAQGQQAVTQNNNTGLAGIGNNNHSINIRCCFCYCYEIS